MVTGRIILICEGMDDAEVVRSLLRAKGINVRVDARVPVNRGISALAKEIDRLVLSALADKRKDRRTCVAVLHDADELSASEAVRHSHRRIAEICSRYVRRGVKRIVANDAIEAWLLADSGVCGWLGIKPSNHDNIRQPKNRFESLLNARGAKVNATGRRQALEHLAGDGDVRSESMRMALDALHGAPCVVQHG